MIELTSFFKLLSDETRLRIIMLLLEEPMCVCEMCGVLELSQPKVSKHLAKLRDNGLVVDERREQFIYYSLSIRNNTVKDVLTCLGNDVNNEEQFKIDRSRLKEKNIYSNQCKKSN